MHEKLKAVADPRKLSGMSGVCTLPLIAGTFLVVSGKAAIIRRRRYDTARMFAANTLSY
jgi:hypothetical protein